MRVLAFALLCACTADPLSSGGARHGRPGEDSGTGEEVEDTGTPASACGPGAVLVDERFCVDVAEGALEEWDGSAWVAASPYEIVAGREVRASSALGRVPQGYISGEEAAAACEAAGKRLCSSEEWLTACQGPEGWIWPYGDAYQEGACNDVYSGTHPVVDFFGTSDGIWDTDHMNDPGINQQPDSLAQSGAFAACGSAWGAFDMHGNLHEWVEDADGTFRGGFYADATINGPGCTYTTTAHDMGYHDYSTGFRCCAEPSLEER